MLIVYLLNRFFSRKASILKSNLKNILSRLAGKSTKSKYAKVLFLCTSNMSQTDCCSFC